MNTPGPDMNDADWVRLSRADGLELATTVLERYGFSASEAATVANHLVESELRGHTPTGLVRLKAIVLMAAKGRKPVRTVREGPGFAQIDGGGNPGSLSGEVAVEVAIAKARETGFSIVALHNSAQAGMSGHYVRLVAEAGFVGAMFTSSYGRVAPFGGIDPLIGTNPIAFAFPASPHAIVIDAATSIVNNGDVETARARGEPLPEGAAVDANGAATVDPVAAAAGALLPIAGHKGYAIGLAMQLFGVLAGGDPVPENRGNFGFFFLVVDPALFGPAEDFAARVAALRDAIKASRPASGVEEIALPGEGSDRRREAGLRDGFPLRRALVEELKGL